MRPKFTERSSEANPFPAAHSWKPVYQRGRAGDTEKVVATVLDSGIDLILKLTEDSPESFGILYVLVVARRTRSGRYQMKDELDRSSLVSYLERYRAYFEGDGRHHIWVRCGDESFIVYDKHETHILYGDLDQFCGVLERLGYEEGLVSVDFAHEHHYNEEFDNDELSIVDSEDYIRFDLVPGQDFEANDPRYK